MSNSVVVKEWKKFRRYKDGAEYYDFSKSVFERLVKEAGAIYKEVIITITTVIFH